MDIRHLKYFSEVAKQLNFTKAATKLHISQPALSKTVKDMEKKLDVFLFYRSSRKLKLTDSGEAFLHGAKQVLQAHEHLMTTLNDVEDRKRGKIKIGIPPMIGATFCSKIVSQYINKFPLINVTLSEVGSNMILEGINNGTLDVGFICHHLKSNNNIEFRQILKDPLMALMHRHHPLSTKEDLSINDLTEQPFIMYHHDFSLYQHILQACEEVGFHPNIVCESSQKDFIIKMVVAKLGIALLPSQIAQHIQDEQVTAIPLLQNTLHLNLGIIWRRNDYISVALQEFISITEKHIEKDIF